MKASRKTLIKLIRDLHCAVVIEASGGEGERNVMDVPAILRRTEDILKREEASGVTSKESKPTGSPDAPPQR